MTSLRGIDVGSPQGDISPAHWITVALTRRFVICRCTEGMDSVDVTFDANVTGAKGVGLPVAAYFVLHPWLDPVDQVTRWFDLSKHLGCAHGELPPVIDIELFHTASVMLTPKEVRTALLATVRAISRLWGRPCFTYTYPDFFRRYILLGATPEELAELAETLLWYAAYTTTMPLPPAPWTKITLWQDSGGDRFKLPSGAPCDDDYFIGTQAELDTLASWSPPVPDLLAGEPVPGLVIPGENA
jgi:GH25 family lysozyme M1 (1,4-beta-N-acetylmuramidase)